MRPIYLNERGYILCVYVTGGLSIGMGYITNYRQHVKNKRIDTNYKTPHKEDN